MLDVGWTELLVIGVVALVVVGPKDLPVMFRTLGRFTAKARAMAREFSRAMEDAAKEAGVDEVARDLRNVTSKKSLGLDALEGAASKFEKWDPLKGAKPATAAAGAAPGSATAKLAAERAARAEARRASAAEKAADAEIAGEEAPPRKAPPKARVAAPKSPAAKLATAKPKPAKPKPVATSTKTPDPAVPARRAGKAKA